MKGKKGASKGLALLLVIISIFAMRVYCDGLMVQAFSESVETPVGDGATITYDANGFGSSSDTEDTTVYYEAPTKLSDADAVASVKDSYGVELSLSDYQDFYAIANAGQLYWFAAYVNNESTHIEDTTEFTATHLTASAVLVADIYDNDYGLVDTDGYYIIDSNGDYNTKATITRQWTPLGNYTLYPYVTFQGTIDGNGYVISGLYINNTSSTYQGLVSYAYEATFTKVEIVDSYFYVGEGSAVICAAAAKTSFDQCINASTIYGGGDAIGGICGTNFHNSAVVVDFSQCTNTGKVISTGKSVGGICGDNHSAGATFYQCTNTGTISVSSGAKSYYGGICGQSANNVTFDSCTNTGRVMGALSSSSCMQAGGILGYGSSDGSYTFTNCTNSGDITGYNNVGGIFGNTYSKTKSSANTIVTNCSNSGTISFYGEGAGGICGNAYVTTITNCSNTGDVVGLGDGATKYAGGIIGLVQKSDVSVSIAYSTNKGNIQATNYVGGIYGYVNADNTDSAVSYCYNLGDVAGTSYIGGVAGYTASSTIQFAYNLGKITGEENTGGIVGGASDSTISNAYYVSDKEGSLTDTTGTAYTTAEFASGAVTYALNNGDSTKDTVIWGQNIDKEGATKQDHPVFNENYSWSDTSLMELGAIVYGFVNCVENTAYSNINSLYHEPTSATNYICKNCSNQIVASYVSADGDTILYCIALEDAWEKACSDSGATVTLYYDCDDVALTVPTSIVITLDLNGYTLSGTLSEEDNTLSGDPVITIKGTLYVTDTSTSAAGKITKGNSGIYVDGGTFYFYGGTITGNIADCGAGVYVNSTDATVVLAGGTIEGNSASIAGGGVYVPSGAGAITVTGALIVQNNTAGSAANNIYLSSADATVILGDLDNGATIGIATYEQPDEEDRIAFSVSNENAANYINYFISDYDDCDVVCESDTLYLYTPIDITGWTASDITVEYTGTSYTYFQEDFITSLYRTILSRTPDSKGYAYWSEKLASGSMTKAEIVRAFLNSSEFAALSKTDTDTQIALKSNFIERLYTKLLQRSPDNNGFTYWCNQLFTGQKSITSIANGFVTSSECVAANLSDEEFINRMYRTFFDREPDSAGKAYWVAKLKNGSLSRTDIVAKFVASPEFKVLMKSYDL